MNKEMDEDMDMWTNSPRRHNALLTHAPPQPQTSKPFNPQSSVSGHFSLAPQLNIPRIPLPIAHPPLFAHRASRLTSRTRPCAADPPLIASRDAQRRPGITSPPSSAAPLSLLLSLVALLSPALSSVVMRKFEEGGASERGRLSHVLAVLPSVRPSAHLPSACNSTTLGPLGLFGVWVLCQSFQLLCSTTPRAPFYPLSFPTPSTSPSPTPPTRLCVCLLS